MWKWIADLPSTNARIFVTLLIYIATAVRYLAWGVPGDLTRIGFLDGWDAWLTLLAVMAGVDALQFLAKRKTQQDPPAAAQPDIEDAAAGARIKPEVAATRDVQAQLPWATGVAIPLGAVTRVALPPSVLNPPTEASD